VQSSPGATNGTITIWPSTLPRPRPRLVIRSMRNVTTSPSVTDVNSLSDIVAASVGPARAAKRVGGRSAYAAAAKSNNFILATIAEIGLTTLQKRQSCLLDTLYGGAGWRRLPNSISIRSTTNGQHLDLTGSK